MRHNTARVSGFTPGGSGVGTPGLIGSLLEEVVVIGLFMSGMLVVRCTAVVAMGTANVVPCEVVPGGMIVVTCGVIVVG